MDSRALLSRQAFAPSCPMGGSWYACSTGAKFVGCCRSDPCKLDCPVGNLMPTSFDAKAYATFPDLTCAPNSGASFYTCTGTKPGPFMGCCRTNPCAAGQMCTGTNLTQSYLTGIPANDDQFLRNTTLPSASRTASNTASRTSTSTATSSSSAQVQEPSSSGTNVGLIVGLTVGAIALAFLLILFFFWRRVKQLITRKTSPNNRDSSSSTAFLHPEAGGYYGSPHGMMMKGKDAYFHAHDDPNQPIPPPSMGLLAGQAYTDTSTVRGSGDHPRLSNVSSNYYTDGASNSSTLVGRQFSPRHSHQSSLNSDPGASLAAAYTPPWGSPRHSPQASYDLARAPENWRLGLQQRSPQLLVPVEMPTTGEIIELDAAEDSENIKHGSGSTNAPPIVQVQAPTPVQVGLGMSGEDEGGGSGRTRRN